MFTPAAGIGQGDPFSPLWFSLCASFVLFAFKPMQSVHPFMFVDDLCVLITSGFCQSVWFVLGSVVEFGQVCGLQLNLSKSAMVLKGNFAGGDMNTLQNCGLPITASARYLGVLISHVTVTQAFSKALGEAQCRASQLSVYSL